MDGKMMVLCLVVAIFAANDSGVGADPQTESGPTAPPPPPPTYVTNSSSGEICPPWNTNKRKNKCLSNGVSTCNYAKRRCKCAPPTQGIGNLACHEPNEEYCAVFNDPYIWGFHDKIVFAQLSCFFFLTELQMPICDTSDPSNVVTHPTAGECNIRVRAWGGRRPFTGKTFMRGADIVFVVTYNGQTYNHFTRIWAEGFKGVYRFFERTNLGPPSNLTIPGAGRIYTVYDRDGDNFGRVIADMCGFEFGLRGVDHSPPPAQQSAGIFIKVNTECDPTYPNSDKMLCSAPEGRGSNIEDHARDLSNQVGRNISSSLALMHLVLTDPTPQDFPGAAPSLQTLMDTARVCAENTLGWFFDALEKCLFIMNDISFLRCYDNTTDLETAVSGMERCIHSVCNNDLDACAEVQQSVLDAGCKVKNSNDTILVDECGLDFNLDNVTRSDV